MFLNFQAVSTGEEAENLSKQDHNYLQEYHWKNKLFSCHTLTIWMNWPFKSFSIRRSISERAAGVHRRSACNTSSLRLNTHYLQSGFFPAVKSVILTATIITRYHLLLLPLDLAWVWKWKWVLLQLPVWLADLMKSYWSTKSVFLFHPREQWSAASGHMWWRENIIA